MLTPEEKDHYEAVKAYLGIKIEKIRSRGKDSLLITAKTQDGTIIDIQVPHDCDEMLPLVQFITLFYKDHCP